MLKSWQMRMTGIWVISIGMFIFIWITYDLFSCFSDSGAVLIISRCASSDREHCVPNLSAFSPWILGGSQSWAFFLSLRTSSENMTGWKREEVGISAQCLETLQLWFLSPEVSNNPFCPSVFWGSGSMLHVAFIFLSPKQEVNHPPDSLYWL